MRDMDLMVRDGARAPEPRPHQACCAPLSTLHGALTAEHSARFHCSGDILNTAVIARSQRVAMTIETQTCGRDFQKPTTRSAVKGIRRAKFTRAFSISAGDTTR